MPTLKWNIFVNNFKAGFQILKKRMGLPETLLKSASNTLLLNGFINWTGGLKFTPRRVLTFRNSSKKSPTSIASDCSIVPPSSHTLDTAHGAARGREIHF
jgi:hypothetical protein